MTNWEELKEDDRNYYLDKAIEILQDHYICTRVWSAWSYGTMTKDDFELAAENDDVVLDTARMLFNFKLEGGK
jgi:hypothetical protein